MIDDYSDPSDPKGKVNKKKKKLYELDTIFSELRAMSEEIYAPED